jgi:hypothetical protein
MNQQQRDGRFGYFAIETSAICNSLGRGGFDAVCEVHLPTTLTCLWALAESLIPGFNLFSLGADDRWRPEPLGAGPLTQDQHLVLRGETEG